jgi:hypothetical protein
MLAKLQLIGPATDLTISCPGLIDTISLNPHIHLRREKRRDKKTYFPRSYGCLPGLGESP